MASAHAIIYLKNLITKQYLFLNIKKYTLKSITEAINPFLHPLPLPQESSETEAVVKNFNGL